MEHLPPPLFRTGPTPLARLMIFSMLSAVVLIADARFNYLQPLRQIAAIAVYPLQKLAAAPGAFPIFLSPTTHCIATISC